MFPESSKNYAKGLKILKFLHLLICQGLKLMLKLKHLLTAGAPSISSITKQFGFSLHPSTDFICVDASRVFLKTSWERSSLKHKHKTI